MPLRLVLADDHYLVREGLRRLLETQPDLEVTAVCEDLDWLLAAVDEEQPDVVVTDIRMPPAALTKGSALRSSFASRTSTWVSSSSASTQPRATSSRCSSAEARGAGTS